MKILVTGAKGFVGKNLCLTLENIANGCDKTRGGGDVLNAAGNGKGHGEGKGYNTHGQPGGQVSKKCFPIVRFQRFEETRRVHI